MPAEGMKVQSTVYPEGAGLGEAVARTKGPTERGLMDVAVAISAGVGEAQALAAAIGSLVERRERPVPGHPEPRTVEELTLRDRLYLIERQVAELSDDLRTTQIAIASR